MGNGLLVVFEGIDGSGKSTQRDHVAHWLRAREVPCLALAQPSDSMAGRVLRAAIRAHRRLRPELELALFVRDRREQAVSKIIPALRRGVVVLLDRHYLSSVAYQGALGLDPGRILSSCLHFSPVADLTLLFDLDPSVAVSRIRRTRDVDPFERLDYLTRVRALYLEWARRVPNTLIVDATEEEQALAARLCRIIGGLLGERGYAVRDGEAYPGVT